MASAPARSASPSGALLQWITPIEWGGRYSVDKLLCLFSYSSSSSTSSIHCWLAFVLTPLPALALSLLLQLVPLDDPARGWRHNGAFFVRTWLLSTTISHVIDLQIELYLPEIRMSRARLLMMNALQGASSVAAVILLSTLTGVFPVPFSQALTAPFYGVCSWILRLAFDWRRITDPTRANKTRRELPKLIKLLSIGIGFLNVYSAFGVAFSQVPERFRPLMTVVLLAIKLVATRLEWRHAGSLVVDGPNDLATAHVAFGSHLFHVLFTSTCLQNAKTGATLSAVVVLSAVQDLATTTVADPLTPLEIEYVHATTGWYQRREVTLLRLYVELVAPIVYLVFVASLRYLKSGQFSPYFQADDLRALAVRLGVQFATKLLGLIAVLQCLPQKVGSPSGFQQLGFALCKMAAIIPAKCLFITMCIFDFQLLHNGNDLSFQFKWLRAPTQQ